MNQNQKPYRRAGRGTINELFSKGGYTVLPNYCLTPDFIEQVGIEGLALAAIFVKAYDGGVHYQGASDGWMRITDEELAGWIGDTTPTRIRRLRRKLLNATPSFFANSLQGITGRGYEYQLRATTASDKVESDVLKRLAARRSTNRRDRCRYESGHLSTSALNVALSYAARGLSVIPIKRSDKTPLIRWTQYQDQRASTLEVQKWLSKWPGANIGIVTGSISNLVVVDIDGDLNEGVKLLADHGVQLPSTTVVKTGNGYHFWFRHPGIHIGTSVRLLKNDCVKIDIRGDGGYVLAPPSVHPSGRRYLFESEADVAELPAELLTLLATPTQTQRRLTIRRASQSTFVVASPAVDLVRVIESAGVPLTSTAAGAFVGVCPFHEDHNPSLSVTPSKGWWHCFGCDKAGTAITFLQLMNGWSREQASQALNRERIAA